MPSCQSVSTSSICLLTILALFGAFNEISSYGQLPNQYTVKEIPGSLFDKSPGTPKIMDPKLRVEVVAENLSFPTSMAFLGPDDIIVLEKERGTVTRIINGAIVSEPLTKVKTASQVERGLLGLAVSGNQSSKTNVFLYFTEISNSTSGGDAIVSNRVYRYNLENAKLVNPKLLLDLPATPGPRHNGGAIELDPAGNLYVPVGDVDGHTTQAQNNEIGSPPDGTSGILRISPNGQPIQSIIGDNGPARKYFGYGIRNSYGLDFDPLNGRLWDTENGAGSADEINLVEPGFNSGWSKIQGKAPASFNYSNLVHFEGKGKYRDPQFTWIDTVGPTKLKFLNTDKLGKVYENDLFVSDVHHGRVYHFDLNSTRTGLLLSGPVSDKVADTDVETRNLIFASDFGGISDMEVGPDGYLYILSFARGIIYRIGAAAD